MARQRIRIYTGLTAPQLAQIGSVVTAWAWLEIALEEAIWGIAGVSRDKGRCITTHLSTPLRLDVLMSLAREHFSDETKVEELNTIVLRVRDLMGKRNKIAHSAWGYGPERTPITYLTKARGRKSHVRYKPEDLDFKGTFSDIQECFCDLWNFSVENNVKPHA